MCGGFLNTNHGITSGNLLDTWINDVNSLSCTGTPLFVIFTVPGTIKGFEQSVFKYN